jgi:pyridoxamine 5'-phosphate oxidase
MMTAKPVHFYNDLSLTLKEIQRILQDGAINRHAAAHHPIVATLDQDGCPTQRVMILRECNWPLAHLRFHTDLRSNKIAEINANNSASVLVYDEPAKSQIRLSGKLNLGTQSVTEEAWTASTEFARRCYMTECAPGSDAAAPKSGLPEWIEGKKPNTEQLISARQNFATLIFEFDRIDWLYLANIGHRRAKFMNDLKHDSWKGSWVIP